MHKLFTSVFLPFFAVVASFAQYLTPTVMSSGGNFAFTGEGYSISYTLGECFVKTSYPGSFIICEGFQHGEKFTGPPPLPEVAIYPNPVTQNLATVYLPMKGEINAYTITLYSLRGQLLYTRTCSDIVGYTEIPIDLKKYGRGLYLIRVQSVNGVFLKTFKIEKI